MCVGHFLTPWFFSKSMAHCCCNPFDIPGHGSSSRKENLRNVTAWMCERAPQISLNSKICGTCRKKLSEKPPSSSMTETDSSGQENEPYLESPQAVTSLNKCLIELGETPYIPEKGHGVRYQRQKMKKLNEAMKKTIISSNIDTDWSEIIQQLKREILFNHKSGRTVANPHCLAKELVGQAN